MKINKKIIRLKQFIKQIVMASEARQSQRMACLKAGKPISLLLALTIILSLFLVAVPMAGIAEAAVYYVRTDGDNSNDGSANDAAHAWLTIQHAVDTVVADDTIIVAAGTYHNDPTDVNKQITLLGANANVDPAGSTDRGGETILTRDDTKSGFYVTASGVIINGFKLGTSTAESSRRINIYDGATDVIIKYNIIMNTWQSSGHGVYIHPTSDGAEISYNTIDNPYWDGIRNDGAEDVVISNNYVNDVNNNLGTFPIVTTGRAVISGNTVTNSRDGIRIDYAGTSTSDRVEVTGNTVSYIEYAGIGMGYGSTDKGKYTYVYNNTVHHANYFGSDGLGDWDYASIHVEEGATNCIIDGNIVYDGVNGIQTWADDVTITNNEIYDMGVTYTGDGIGPAGTKTVGGRVYKNSGILVGSNWGSGDIDPTGVVIENNNIHDNYWGLFYSADLANGVDATNNWWGDASGPKQATTNPSATGDEVSDNVDYDPWYIDEEKTTLSNAIAEVWVDDNYDDGNCDGHTWLVDAFDNIQDGINGVDEGGTVYVAAGTYNEGITGIDKTLTIIGATTPSKPIINPTADTDTANAIGPTGRGWFQIHNGATVNLENLVFDGTGKLIHTAVHYHGDSTGGTVESCDFMNIAHTPSGYQGRGINNYGQYVKVLNCTFNNIYRIGVFTYNATATTLIDGCTYTGKGTGDWLDYAFEAGNGGNITVQGCTITDCKGVVDIWGSAGILAGTQWGHGTAATITGSDIYNNSNGVVFGSDPIDTTVATLTGNNIYNNDHDGVVVSAGTNVVTGHDNNIYGNGDYGVNVVSGSTIHDFENNWWGAASGPTHTSNPGGTGDAVSDNVNFIPFLASSGGEVVNNVSITKSGPTSANSGVNITYTITYKNIGTNYATNVVITETYPSEVEFVSANPVPDIGNNKWTIGTLAPGAEGTITVTVHIK